MKKLIFILGAMMAVLIVMATTIVPLQADSGKENTQSQTTRVSDYHRSDVPDSVSNERNGSRLKNEARHRYQGRGDNNEETREYKGRRDNEGGIREDEERDSDEESRSGPNPLTPTPTPPPTPPTTPNLVSYSATIQPILGQRCNSCHPKAGVNLSSYSGTKAAANRLPGMGRNYLSTAELKSLTDWINQGALNN